MDGTDLVQDININRFRGFGFSQRMEANLVLCKDLFCIFQSQGRYLGSGEVFMIGGGLIDIHSRSQLVLKNMKNF